MQLSADALTVHADNYRRLLEALPDDAAIALTMGVEDAADSAEDLEGDESDALNSVGDTLQTHFGRTIEAISARLEQLS